MKCWFCGTVPTVLPHNCLLDKRNAEDARMLELAQQEAAQASREDGYKRAIFALTSRLVNTEARLASAEGRVGYMEYEAAKAAR